MNLHIGYLRRPSRQFVWQCMLVALMGLFIFFFAERITPNRSIEVFNHSLAFSPIPNRVHFVYILDNPDKDLIFPFSHFLSVFSTEHYWRPHEIFLHTNAAAVTIARARLGESGKWSRLILNMRNLRIVSVTVPVSAGNGREIQLMEHKSDFIRVEAVRRFGGAYLDFDNFALRDIKVLRHSGFNAIAGRQLGGQLVSGTFLAKNGSKMIDGWSKEMNVVFDGGWTTHSNEALTKVSERLVPQSGEMLIMERNAFAPGSWLEEDACRLFEVHDEMPSSFPDKASVNDARPLADDAEIPEIAPPRWATDWSSTYILHAFKPSRSGAQPHGFKEITPHYVLEKQSNFARAVHPIVQGMIQRGFLSQDDVNPEAPQQT